MARPGSQCELGWGILLDDKQETFQRNGIIKYISFIEQRFRIQNKRYSLLLVEELQFMGAMYCIVLHGRILHLPS